MITTLFILCLGLHTPVAADDVPVEKLLPGGALMLISTDDLKSMAERSKTMPIAKILEEKEVQAFLKQPRLAVEEFLKKGLDQLKSQGGIDVNLDHVLTTNYRRFFIGLTHLEIKDESADIGLVVGIEPVGDTEDILSKLADALKKNHASETSGGEQPTAGPRMTEETYHGVSIRSFSGLDASGPKAFFAKKGTLSLMCLSEKLMKGVLDRADSPGKDCLADDAEFALVTSKVGPRPPGSSLMFFAPKMIIESLLVPLKKGLAEQGQNEWLPKVDSLYQASGLSALKSVASVSYPDNGVAVVRNFVHTDAEPKGLIAAFLSSRSVDKSKLTWVPKNAEAFNLGFSNIGQIYDSVMAMVEIAQPGLRADLEGKLALLLQPPAKAVDGQTEPPPAKPAADAYDFRRDLLGSLDGESLYFQRAGQGLEAAGDMVFAGKVTSVDKVRRGLELMLKIPSHFELPVEAKEEKFDDTSITMLDLTQALGPMAAIAGAIRPCFAFRNDYLVCATTLDGLKGTLQRMKAAPADSVLDSEDFAKAWARLPSDKAPSCVGYTNVKASFESMYNGLVTFTMMPPLSQMLQQVPIDLALLPTAEVVSKHLFGSVSASYHDAQGEMSISYSPVGAEVIALVAGAGLFAGMSSYQIQKASGESAPAPDQDTKASPAERIEVDISLLRAAITVYKLDREKLPASLDDLLVTSENFPNGYLGGRRDLPKDPWDHPYVYTLTGPKGYQIRSIGPNGVDDQGEGDDIVPGRPGR